MNPFYNLQQMPINSNPFGGGPFGNMMNMMQQFNQFKSTFQGDPQQKVQELLSSGKMTQQQFNQLSQMAQQLMNEAQTDHERAMIQSWMDELMG